MRNLCSFVRGMSCATAAAEREAGTSAEPETIVAASSARLLQLLEAELADLRVERLIVGVFFVAIKLSNGCAGVAYTPPELIDRASQHILKKGMTRFAGLPVAEILQERIVSPFAHIIRLATMNALSVPLFAGGRYACSYSEDLSAMTTLFRGRRICLVGAIIPLLKQIKNLSPAAVSIIDKKEATRQEAEAGWGTFYPPEQLPDQLARCQTAIFTGAAVANGSIEELLALTPKDAAVAIVGPSAGFIPDMLFERQVVAVGTSVVTDADRALEILGEGGGAYHLFGSCMQKLNIINPERLAQLGLH